jgi:hypothetical protein
MDTSYNNQHSDDYYHSNPNRREMLDTSIPKLALRNSSEEFPLGFKATQVKNRKQKYSGNTVLKEGKSVIPKRPNVNTPNPDFPSIVSLGYPIFQDLNSQTVEMIESKYYALILPTRLFYTNSTITVKKFIKTKDNYTWGLVGQPQSVQFTTALFQFQIVNSHIEGVEIVYCINIDTEEFYISPIIKVIKNERITKQNLQCCINFSPGKEHYLGLFDFIKDGRIHVSPYNLRLDELVVIYLQMKAARSIEVVLNKSDLSYKVKNETQTVRCDEGLLPVFVNRDSSTHSIPMTCNILNF